MGWKRSSILMLGLLAVRPMAAHAQAPERAPLVLTLPSSARVASLGSAWVAGRDQDVIFTNPAQLIGTRTDLSASFARFGPEANGATMSSAYAGGKWSFTLGWGFQYVNFRENGQSSPYSPDALLVRGVNDAQTSVAAIGGAFVYKRFRIGVAGKYASDRTSVNRHATLLDVGMARTFWGGVGAVSVQNLGHKELQPAPVAILPRQVKFGWSTARPAGPLDLGVYGEVLSRGWWTSPAIGIEAGYSWIEGYTVTLRGGLRRPESLAEKPVSLGAGLSADRVTVDYAIRFFDTGNRQHLVTVRWR